MKHNTGVSVTYTCNTKDMKYLKSLLKYIIGVILYIALLVWLQLIMPRWQIELTLNQAVIFVVIGIIFIAVALKIAFDKR